MREACEHGRTHWARATAHLEKTLHVCRTRLREAVWDDSRFLQGDVVWATPWAMLRRPPRRRGASATVRLVVREKQQGLEGRPDDVVVRDAPVLGGEGVAHEHVALLLRQLQLAPRNRLEERGWVEQA